VVTVNEGQGAGFAEYVTVYTPTVLVEGVIAPVLEFMVNPAVEEYVPPAVPTLVTEWAVETLLQYPA
jgi:hypothetical protein